MPYRVIQLQSLVPGKPVTEKQCATYFTTELYKKISNQMFFIVLASVIALSGAQVIGIFTPINVTNPNPNNYNNNNNNNAWPALPNNNNNNWAGNNNRPIGWVNPQPNNVPKYNPPVSYNNNNNHPVNVSNSTTKSGPRDTLYGTCSTNAELLFKTLITKTSSAWNIFTSNVKEISFPDINSNVRVRSITCIKVTDNSNTKGAKSSITGGGVGKMYVKLRFKSPGAMDFALEIYGIPERR